MKTRIFFLFLALLIMQSCTQIWIATDIDFGDIGFTGTWKVYNHNTNEPRGTLVLQSLLSKKGSDENIASYYKVDGTIEYYEWFVTSIGKQQLVLTGNGYYEYDIESKKSKIIIMKQSGTSLVLRLERQ